MSADRRTLNALYSDNRLKLGVFGANVSNGCAATTAPGHLEMNWPNSRDIVTTADRAGFEALVPVARWKGFGGETNFNGTCYETLTWAAGMGAVTNHASIFCTTHVPTIHPIVAAKQCTTVDHLAGGRFALNVVCGWYSQELRMFGLQTMDHDARYAYADEWVEVVRKLWTEEAEFDYDGKFFHIEKGFHQPKPLQRPHPPIMNAGSSGIGARFAAKNADMAFIGFYEENLEKGKASIAELRRLGREEFAREFQILDELPRRLPPDREGGQRLRALLHLREGRSRRGRDHHRGARPQGSEHVAGNLRADEAADGGRLGRISAGRHAGADRR